MTDSRLASICALGLGGRHRHFRALRDGRRGTCFGTASNTNGMATGGAVFELFDVGLYLDPNATGVPPPWQMPDEAQELAACQRYWEFLGAGVIGAGQGAGTAVAYIAVKYATKRIAPAIAHLNAGGGNLGAYNTAGTAVAVTSGGAINNVGLTAAMVNYNVTMAAGQGAVVYSAASTSGLSINARM